MGILQALRMRRSRRLASALPPWAPSDAAACGHVVQFYGGPFPTQAVGAFVREGLASGEIALLIASPDHVRAVDDLLGDQKGRVLYLDANETLAKFMVHGRPDRQRFLDTVGDIVQQAAAIGNGRVRAFGEMVVLLCEQGEPEAAHQLELLWNDLGRRHRLKLLCAYPLAVLGGRNKSFQTKLRDSHSHAAVA
ncbi:MAG: MEDS domain-containing protein [Thermoplasmatota archaeon]